MNINFDFEMLRLKWLKNDILVLVLIVDVVAVLNSSFRLMIRDYIRLILRPDVKLFGSGLKKNPKTTRRLLRSTRAVVINPRGAPNCLEKKKYYTKARLPYNNSSSNPTPPNSGLWRKSSDNPNSATSTESLRRGRSVTMTSRWRPTPTTASSAQSIPNFSRSS